MDTSLLDIKFSRIGARLKVADRLSRRTRNFGVISLDVQTDRQGEFFEIVKQPGAEAEVTVLDVQPADRHLLLLVREGKEKSKFLFGHDERHWFVAGIPEAAPVGTVRQAKEALKPAEVLSTQAGKRLGAKARNRRKNAAFVRQGAFTSERRSSSARNWPTSTNAPTRTTSERRCICVPRQLSSKATGVKSAPR